MKKMIFLSMFFILFFSCKKDSSDPINLESKSVSIFTNEKHQIVFTGEEPVTFSSENDFVAEVSTTGLITANKVGSTQIKVSNSVNSQSFSVTVDPKYNLYRQPLIDWNLTRSDVISTLGLPISQTDDGILYISPGSVEADYEMYLFDSNNRLETSSVIGSSVYFADVSVFLLERYKIIDVPNYLLFVNAQTLESSTLSVVLTYLNINEYAAMYMSTPNPKSSKELKLQELLKSHQSTEH